MERIYKYPLYIAAGIQYVSMPAGAEIVHFDMQDDRPCIWAKVNPYEATLQREFYILGAGYDIHDSLEYVGAIQQGIYVWHLFEKKL